MRKLIRRLFGNLVIRLANKYSSRPDRKHVHQALSKLHTTILAGTNKNGKVINASVNDKFILFSDQHKGTKNAYDDFILAEPNYITALDYYNANNYHYINLGDSEELWKNLIWPVIEKNKKSTEKEIAFLKRKAFTKIFGNHDLMWGNDPLSILYKNKMYKEDLPVYEAVLLKFKLDNDYLDILLTHGHQGDLQSDGNWFSKWFVNIIWAPLQAYIGINPNTPAYDNQLKTNHNKLMYSWVASKSNLILVTGHTHQPVFTSLTHLERLYGKLRLARRNNVTEEINYLTEEINKRIKLGDKAPQFRNYKPNYFNTGCCCYSDGDITGIEIDSGKIRLIKWTSNKSGKPERILLEETELTNILNYK